MAKSYWNSKTKSWGKHPGIPLDDYCVPVDAAEVRCDMQSFTCKEYPALPCFDNTQLLEKDEIIECNKGDLISLKQIVPFLMYIKENRILYLPSKDSVKWNYCPYKTLRFTRVSRSQFFISGGYGIFPPLNWKRILQDTRYGQIHTS